MTNLQFVLAVSIPTFTVLVGILYNNARFNSIDARLISIEGDLRQFYKDLGKHEGKIEMLEHRK